MGVMSFTAGRPTFGLHRQFSNLPRVFADCEESDSRVERYQLGGRSLGHGDAAGQARQGEGKGSGYGRRPPPVHGDLTRDWGRYFDAGTKTGG